jgi:hypothetical protein
MVRPEPTSGRESANRRQNTTENRRRNRKSKEKTLVYVVSSLFAVTKCYSCSKIVSQLFVVPPINRLI